MLQKLYTALSVDESLFDLKLEVVYPCGGQPLPPVIIKDDNGVSLYVRDTMISVQHRTPLCVIAVPKDIYVGQSSKRIAETVPDVNFQQFTCDAYQPPSDFQQHVPDKTPVYNHLHSAAKQETCFDYHTAYNIHPNVFHQSTSEAFNNQETNYISQPIIDLNESSKDEFGLFNSSPPYAYLKTMRPNGNDDAIFFRLLRFTANVVARGSGPVDLKSPEKTGDLYVGQIFDNKKALKKAASLYAIRENFQFLVGRSRPDLWLILCIEEKCEWSLQGVQVDFSDMFRISKFFNIHTCQADTHCRDNRQAAPWIVADIIKNKIVEDDSKYTPQLIITYMRQTYGIEMTYEKTWRCKQAVLNLVRGTPEASYAALPSFLYMIQGKNPSTLQHFVLDENDQSFKYCFLSLGASRHGFKSCRLVICVDGIFLKSRFGGVMLCAIALDVDNHLFPIAFAIVDSENHDSWIYFMVHLKDVIGGDIEDLVFVSDRHQSIANALNVVFPNAHHGACYYHVKQNVHSKFKTKLCDADLYAAAYAYGRSVFKRNFHNIQLRNPCIATYLYEIGFHKWARSYFPGNRYNVMTSKYAESFNNTTRDARTFLVTSMLEFIRFKLQSWLFERREAASQSTSTLSPMRERPS